MRLFTPIARSYELINHVLTFGLDIIWRRRAARIAASDGGSCWLDVCTGTGEMARYLIRYASHDTKPVVVALDRNRAMLATAAQTEPVSPVHYIEGDVYHMPFPDGTFDLVTISFAARTLGTSPDALKKVFREIFRVIVPGGRFVIADTSQPKNSIVRWLFHRYVRWVVTPIGGVFSGTPEGYAYLAHTIPRFPDAETIAAILRKCGFVQVSYTRYLWGAAAVHRAVKQ